MRLNDLAKNAHAVSIDERSSAKIEEELFIGQMAGRLVPELFQLIGPRGHHAAFQIKMESFGIIFYG